MYSLNMKKAGVGSRIHLFIKQIACINNVNYVKYTVNFINENHL